jgi:AcrR family transcriptional regulator
MAKPVKREYRSPLRESQARATRRAILAAAARLFVERGYAATSIDEIAAEAGVGRATVFTSVGGKPELLKQAYDVALAGDDEPVAIVDRPGPQAVLAAADGWQLVAGFVEFATPASGRIARIYEAVHGAAHADAAAREMWERILRERRVGMDNIVRALQAKGPLRDGLDPAGAAEILYALGDPWLYHLLVFEQGWSEDRYGAWLTRTLQEQLLPPTISPEGA